MKIALFTHVYIPFTNGIATSVSELASNLKLKGHDVIIVTNNYDNYKNICKNDHYKIISLPIFYQNLKTPLLINPSLYKYLLNNNIDLIHTHSDFGLAFLGRKYAKFLDIPIIQTYHCNYLEYAKEHFGKKSEIILKKPIKYYTKVLCKTANRIIVPSENTKELINDKFNIKSKIDVIPNGINLDKFNKKIDIKSLKDEYNISKDDFVILSISRLSKEKKIENIIKVFSYFKNYNNIKLLIVGGGPEAKKLINLSKKLNLNNIIFTGEVAYSNIQKYYQLGDVFINDSQFETQGLSTIEALASSIPCICPNIPFYNKLIDDLENGMLYNNYNELISIIKLLYNNKKILLSMKENARTSSLKFSIDEAVFKLEKLYEEEKKKKLKYNKERIRI